jgi:glycosyltransferase involved in cell wall biosynthesis
MNAKTLVKTPLGRAALAKKTKSQKLNGKVIVQILPALNHGGVERGSVEMAQAIIDAGGRAVVISSGGMLESQLKRIGAEHITLDVHSKNPLKWPMVRRKLRLVLQDLKPDLVHMRSRAPAWIAFPVCKALRLKTITTVHGRFKAGNLFKKFYNSIMVRSDVVIAISDYVAGLIWSQFPEAKDKTVTIHRGVDIHLFDPKAVASQRVIKASETLVLPDGLPVVMLPGRPTKWKGWSVLVEAMGKLKDRDFMLVLVGAGDGDQDFQQKLMVDIDNASIASKCRISKSMTDMPAALMLADVVVMPSVTPEPFGRVAIEASAMGCPVVAFNHGGAAESIIDGETGWLAEPVEVDALAEAIKQGLSMTKKNRKIMASHARTEAGKIQMHAGDARAVRCRLVEQALS